jgi:hypothetical protein
VRQAARVYGVDGFMWLSSHHCQFVNGCQRENELVLVSSMKGDKSGKGVGERYP